MTLRSAIEVVLSGGVAATVDGKELADAQDADNAKAEKKNYVAIGTSMIFKMAEANPASEDAETPAFDGYLVNVKGGDKLPGNTWVVKGPEKATVYGAYEVTLSGGVTATYEEAEVKAASSVTSGQVVAAGQVVKATAPTDSGVVDYVQSQLAYNKVHEDAAIAGPLNLTSATRVNINVGTLTAWGQTEDCATKAEDAQQATEGKVVSTVPKKGDKVIYVMPGTFVKVDGKGGKETVIPVVYEGGELNPQFTAVDNVVVFQVGNQLIEIKLDPEANVKKAAALVKKVRAAIEGKDIGVVTVSGNMVIATGNAHYLGKPFTENENEVTSYNHSVARELKIFLNALHDEKYATISYQGVEYTWHNKDADNGYTSGNYFNAEKKSIINVVVEESEKVFPNYAEGEMTVELDVEGLPIIFKVVIDNEYDKPLETKDNAKG